MSTEPAQTLGQRIDAVLEPLYAEAEQHRVTIAEATEQQQALQQKIDAATQGLGQIESRMAEVVRAMAGQEPVIAAMVGEGSQAEVAGTVAESVEQSPPSPVAEPEAAQAQPEPAESEPELEPTPQPVAEPAAQPVAQAEVAEQATDEQEMPTVELDPAADAGAVDEVSALLDAPPVAAEAEPAPKVDLAAAAERAAATAKRLRENATAK